MSGEHTLVIGYGNPARGDDGLGCACVNWLVTQGLPLVDTRIGYQLAVEDAITLSAYQRVLFVDASVNGAAPFEYYRLTEQAVRHLDTHSVSPGALMYLAETLFAANTLGNVLAIRGYSFTPFDETITARARENLYAAQGFLAGKLTDRDERSTNSVALP